MLETFAEQQEEIHMYFFKMVSYVSTFKNCFIEFLDFVKYRRAGYKNNATNVTLDVLHLTASMKTRMTAKDHQKPIKPARGKSN